MGEKEVGMVANEAPKHAIPEKLNQILILTRMVNGSNAAPFQPVSISTDKMALGVGTGTLAEIRLLPGRQMCQFYA